MEELKTIMERLAAFGWELPAVPARQWLAGDAARKELQAAIRQADAERGRCACKVNSLHRCLMEAL